MSAIIDYAQQAQRLLASQFQDAASLKKLVAILSEPFQELEIEFQKLKFLRALALADGAQLDQLGTLLDLPRGGLSDALYRAALRLRVRRNICNGSPDAIIEYARIVSGATVIGYSETTAAYQIDHNGDPLALTDAVLQDVTGAGILAHAEFIVP